MVESRMLIILQPKTIGVRSVVLMLLTTCLGVRWIIVAGSIGPSALIFWLLAALVFLLPLSLIIIELSLNYKGKNGGIYLWTKDGLGEKAGFLNAWLYWINNVFYYPGLLTFVAVNFTYVFGRPDLANNRHFIFAVVVIFFWTAVILNIKGIKWLTKVTSLSGLFNFRLALFIVIAGFYYIVCHGSSATNFAPHNFIPHANIWRSLSNFSILIFALSGVELIPAFAKSIEKPEKNLVRAIIIGGIVLVVLYIFGTIAVNLILSPAELNDTTGLIAAISALTNKLHWSIWVAKFLILSFIMVEFGSLNLWLIAPTIMFFHCSEPGILPKWLQRINRNYIPANALVFQGIMVTVIALLTQYMPTVNAMYLILVLMATILYFLTYIILVIAYLRIRKKNILTKTILSDTQAKIAASLVFASVALGIFLSFVPTSDLTTSRQIVIYELELIGGPVVFIIIGAMIYAHRRILNKIRN